MKRAAIVLLVAACGDDGGPVDGGTDMDASAPGDAALDASPPPDADPAMDAGPDAPSSADGATDAPSDASVDGATDAGPGACPDRPAELVMAPTYREFMRGGGVGSAERFTVTNRGGSPTGVVSHSFGGPDGDVFSAIGSTCMGVMLDPCTTCFIDVVFNEGPPGPAKATLIASADPGGMAAATLLTPP
jgi:hypothetical protein